VKAVNRRLRADENAGEVPFGNQEHVVLAGKTLRRACVARSNPARSSAVPVKNAAPLAKCRATEDIVDLKYPL
jgi:hypothetical protein